MKVLIETERLNIQVAGEEDIDKIIELENHPENRRFIWQGSYEEHLREIGCKNTQLLIFKEKTNNKIVGFSLSALDSRSDVFELRRIAVAHKGRGYGREAISEIMKYSFNRLGVNRFWLDVYPDNEVGIKLYKSLGMKLEGVLRQSYKADRGYLDQMIFSILRDEYFEKY